MLNSEIRAEARKRLAGKWGKAALLSLAYFAVAFVIGFVEALFPKDLQWIPSLANAIITIPLAYGLLIQYLKLYNGENFGYFDFLSQGFKNFGRSWKVTLWIALKMIIPVILLIVAIILMTVGMVGSAVGIFDAANKASMEWQRQTMLSTDFGSYIASPQIAYSPSSYTGGFGVLTLIASILFFVSIIWLIIKSYSYQLSQLVAIENTNMTAKDSVNTSKELMKGKKAKLFFLQLSFIGWSILCSFTLGIGMLWLLPYIQVAIVVFYKNAAGNTVSSVKTDETVITEQ